MSARGLARAARIAACAGAPPRPRPSASRAPRPPKSRGRRVGQSTLIQPWPPSISLKPWTAWRRMSSARRRATSKLRRPPARAWARQLSRATVVWQAASSCSRACAANSSRRPVSKAKGWMPRPRATAPFARRRRAISGAAPPPVPPARPATTKARSTPARASSSISDAACAAAAARAASPPEPCPPVPLSKSSRSMPSARARVWALVSTARKRRPSGARSRRRTAALTPAPPTPTIASSGR